MVTMAAMLQFIKQNLVQDNLTELNQRLSNGFNVVKNILSQGSRGGPTFSRGVQIFLGGVQKLTSIETHITCDFLVGSGPPIPPLDQHMTWWDSI